MNKVKLNEEGLLELLESLMCRADALVCAIRQNIESSEHTLYMVEMGYNLDTTRQLLSDAMKYHADLKELIKQGQNNERRKCI